MQLNPYLLFNGNCEEAFKFYEKCLGGKIMYKMTHGETPMKDQVPPAWHNKIIHISMSVGKDMLMGSDAPPDHYEKPGGMSVSLSVDTPAEAERIFHALEENATVRMPIQETFWAQRFGMLVDRFGTPWMINCDKKQ